MRILILLSLAVASLFGAGGMPKLVASASS